MAETIDNHGIVGDLRTIALVGLDATIDFCCWPNFDSPTVFASLLDDERGGRFELMPMLGGEPRRKQLYLHDTNVLLTRSLAEDGVAEISDFMSIGDDDGGQRLVRRAKAIRNDVRFRIRCAPAFDYGRAEHRAERDGDTIVFTSLGDDATTLRLRSAVPLEIRGGVAEAEFELAAGSSAEFVLEDASLGDRSDATRRGYGRGAFKRTSDYWRAWSNESTYRGRWREVVGRSALVLKLLSSREYGSLVAAGTFGLPEAVGLGRNWDYRYTWLRDAAFSVYAFLRLGYVDEANAFVRWLQSRAEKASHDGSLRVVYRSDGTSGLEELELAHLRGYANSVPVRIGNGAENQVQLDIYGELMDSLYLSDKYGEQVSWQGWNGISRAIDWIAEHWREPDRGIWEMRSDPREYLHSRLMCWVAVDRATRLARKRSLPADFLRWASERDAIYHEIHEHFWNEDLGAFTQVKGGDTVDASCLLMPLVRFIAPTDPRWLSTLAVVGDVLTDDSLVFRYRDDDGQDGLTGSEGTFNMCTFWYVECLARAGDLAKARYHFEKMLGYANHLGLFAEQTGPSGEQLGNFPQAFTHMALISAAFYLDRALGA